MNTVPELGKNLDSTNGIVVTVGLISAASDVIDPSFVTS